MSPLAALLVLVEQGSTRRQLRDVLEGCAWGCADRPPMTPPRAPRPPANGA